MEEDELMSAAVLLRLFKLIYDSFISAWNWSSYVTISPRSGKNDSRNVTASFCFVASFDFVIISHTRACKPFTASDAAKDEQKSDEITDNVPISSDVPVLILSSGKVIRMLKLHAHVRREG